MYIEEAGIDNRLYREYARAPKGQKIVANVCGKKRERIRIIGGLKEGKFIAALLWSEKTAKDWGIIHECILQNFMSY